MGFWLARRHPTSYILNKFWHKILFSYKGNLICSCYFYVWMKFKKKKVEFFQHYYKIITLQRNQLEKKKNKKRNKSLERKFIFSFMNTHHLLHNMNINFFFFWINYMNRNYINICITHFLLASLIQGPLFNIYRLFGTASFLSCVIGRM